MANAEAQFNLGIYDFEGLRRVSTRLRFGITGLQSAELLA